MYNIKASRPNRRTILGALLLLVLLLAVLNSCSSVGSCTIPSPTGRDDWAHCSDNWTKQECADHGDALDESTTFSSKSCERLGFTKQCPGEGATWRMSSYPCD